jgi:hypothetical protein
MRYLRSLVAVAALFATANVLVAPSYATTVTYNPLSPFDFHTVAPGAIVTIEITAMASNTLSSTEHWVPEFPFSTDPWSGDVVSGCLNTSLTCEFAVSFSPTAIDAGQGFALNFGVLLNSATSIPTIESAYEVRGGVAGVPPVPIPAALPLFATGLAALGLLGWRRKRKAAAVAA